MKRLFQSLSRTNDGAFIIDHRHRIIFWNRAAEEILGYSAEEVAGQECYEILGGRGPGGSILCQRYCRVVIQAERGEILPNQDVLARTRMGADRWLNVTTFTFPAGDKNTTQVIVHLFRDVTEQKKHKRFVDSVMAASDRLQWNEAIPDSPWTPQDSRLDRLTPRERQVLELLSEGLGTNEIAGTITISQSTVRNHVQNILSKLGAHSRLEAIAYAYQNGLSKS